MTNDEINLVFENAFKNGTTSVSFPDGKSVTYRSVDEMIKIRKILINANNELIGVDSAASVFNRVKLVRI